MVSVQFVQEGVIVDVPAEAEACPKDNPILVAVFDDQFSGGPNRGSFDRENAPVGNDDRDPASSAVIGAELVLVHVVDKNRLRDQAIIRRCPDQGDDPPRKERHAPKIKDNHQRNPDLQWGAPAHEE